MPEGLGPQDELLRQQDTLAKLTAHDVNRRVSAFPLQMINDAPFTVASLALGSLSTPDAMAVGTGMREGWGWLKSLHSTPDQPGSGNTLAADAMALQAKRTQIQTQQQGVQTAFSNPVKTLDQRPDGIPKNAIYAGGNGADSKYSAEDPLTGVTLTQTASQWDAWFRAQRPADLTTPQLQAPASHSVTVGDVNATLNLDGHVYITTGNTQSPNVNEALRQLQEQVPTVNLNQDNLSFQHPGVVGSGLALASDTTRFVSKPFDILGSAGADIRNAGAGVPGLHYLTTPLGFGVQGIGKGTSYLFGGATDVIAGGGLAQLGNEYALATGKPGVNPVNYMFPGLTHHGPVGSGAGAAVVDALGIKPSDPAYEQTKGVVNFIATWVVGSELAGGFAAGHAGATELPYDEAANVHDFSSVQASIYHLVQSVKKTGDLSIPLSESGWGRRFLADTSRIILGNPDNPSGALQLAYKDRMIPPDLADILGTTDGSKAQIGWAVNEYYRTMGVDEGALMQNIDSIDTKLQDPNLSADDAAQLQAQKAVDEHRLATPDQVPPDLIPKPKAWTRLSNGVAKTWFGHILQVLYDPFVYAKEFGSKTIRVRDAETGKWIEEEQPRGAVTSPLNPASFVRSISGHGLVNPFKGDAPPDAFARNADFIKSYFRNAGVPATDVARMLDKASAVKNGADFFDLANEAVGILFDNAKRRGADVSILQKMTKLWKTQLENSSYATVTEDITTPNGAETRLEPVLARTSVDGSGNTIRTPLPVATSQMAGFIPFPSAEAMIEVTRLRKIIQGDWSSAGPLGKLTYNATFGLVHRLADAATTVLKPLQLAGRAIPIMLRHQLDSGAADLFDATQNRTIFARTRILGDLTSEVRTGVVPDEVFYGRLRDNPAYSIQSAVDLDNGTHQVTYTVNLPEINKLRDPMNPRGTNPADLGALVPQALDNAKDHTRPIVTSPWNADGSGLRPGVVQARYESIMQMASAPEQRALIDLGPKAWVEWMRSPAGKPYLDQLQGSIDASGRTLEDFAARQYQSLQELAGGDNSLLDAMRTGQWYRPALEDAQAVGDRWNWKQARSQGMWRAPMKSADLVDLQTEYEDLLHLQQTLGEQIIAARERTYPGGGSPYEVNSSELADLLQRRIDMTQRLDQISGKLGMESHIPLSDADATFRALESDIKDGTHVLPEKMRFDPGGKVIGRDQVWREAGRAAQRVLYKPMRVVSYADLKMARGSTFATIWKQQFDRLESMGYSEEDAYQYATTIAADYTKQLHTSLGQRTSAETAARNIFWYAPVTRQFLRRWFFDLPQKYTWPVGIGYLANRVNLIGDLLHSMGALTSDSKGNPQLGIPGTSWYVNPLHLSLATSPDLGVTPSTLPSVALAEASKRWAGPDGSLTVLSRAMMPYGLNVNFFGAAIDDFYQVLFPGRVNPFEIYSHDAQQEVIYGANINALRMAQTQMLQAGHKPPSIEDFLGKYADPIHPGHLTPVGESAYRKAVDAYDVQLETKAKSIAAGEAFRTALGSVLSPSVIHQVDPNEALWNNYYATHIANIPAGPNQALLKAEARYQFLKDHPTLIAYTLPKSLLGTASRTLPFTDTGTQQYYDDLYTGKRQILPTWDTQSGYDYIHYMTGMESYYLMNLRYQSELDQIAGKGGTAQLLASGYTRSSEAIAHATAWDTYLTAINPSFAAMLTQQRLDWAATGGTLPTSEATQLSIKGLEAVRELATSTANDGIRSQDAMTVIHQFEAQAASAGKFDVSTVYGKYAEGMNWYFTKVLDPYYSQVQPIHDQITAAQASGQDTTAMYGQIRQIQFDYSQKDLTGPDGMKYPTPEQVSWGNLSPGEQMVKKARWASQPATWLSPFAITQLTGSKPDAATWDALTAMGNNDATIAAAIKTYNISPSSNAYQALQSYKLTQDMQIAQSSGSATAVQLAQMANQPPFERMLTFKVITDPAFTQLATTARYIIQALQAQGLSYKSDSGEAGALKTWFFPQIDKVLASDPTLLDQMHFALATGNQSVVGGSDLYDRLFFDSFGSSTIVDTNPYTFAPAPGSTLAPTGTGG